MSKININELSIRELKEIASELFPEMSIQDINSTPLGILQTMVMDEIEISISLAPLEEGDESFELYSSMKHTPSRKKKANRCKKNNRTQKYRKEIKEGDLMAKHIRKRVDEDTTNRAYLNKASKSYVPYRASGYCGK